MKKYLLLSVAMIFMLAVDAVGATSKLSSYTGVFLNMRDQGLIDADGRVKFPEEMLRNKVGLRTKAVAETARMRPMTTLTTEDGVQMVESFVRLADGGSVADIEAAGAIVTNEIGDLIIAKIPVDAIETLAGLDAVERISISRPVRVLNDVAREVTHADVLHTGSQTDQPYTGEGVIVGIVDGGIDYNHIDFKDEEGNSRVVRAYCANSWGDGKTYSTPEDIAGLTTDDRTSTHGTHVAGTAAGSYTGNGLQGMAPGADLYLCGLGQAMTTTSIIARADEVVEYAREVGKPVVVNFSLGSNVGPKLGTDEVAMALDEMAGDGVIFVLAAGNEGDINLYINKPYANPSGEEQFKTMLITPEGGSDLHMCSATCYSRQPSAVQFAVVNTSTGEEVYESEVLSPEDGQSHTISSLGRYFSGVLYVTFDEVEDLQEIAIEPYMLYSADGSNRYRVAVKFYGEQGDEMNMWSDGYMLVLDDGGDPEFTAGTPDCSINEMATGSKTISVGAYTSKLSWTSINTQTYYYTDDDAAEVGTMASFSSYGRDMNGEEHPAIVAPGYGLASAYNRYASNSRQSTVSRVTVDGNDYDWGMDAGTSMACPVVTGIIATWLQRNPSLNVDDIKYIFAATAQKPEKYGQGVAAQWGPNGLIDAYAGWGSCSGVDEVSAPGREMLFVYPNPSDGRFRVVAQGEDEVSLAVYSTGGALMYSRNYATDGGRVNVDLQGELPAGIYILKLQGEQLNYSGKLVIR